MSDLEFRGTEFPGGSARGGSVAGWPCAGPITQGFGEPSVTGRGHGGIDIAATTGTPVFAPATGVLVRHSLAESDWEFGNWVAIDHPGTRWYSAYAHLSAFGAPEGPVEAGEVIGYAGETGVAFGAHLHWAVGTSPWFALDFDQLRSPADFVVAPPPAAVLSLDARVARLERVVAGNGVRLPRAGGTGWDLVTGEAALSFIDRDGHSLHLGLARTQDVIAELREEVRRQR